MPAPTPLPRHEHDFPPRFPVARGGEGACQGAPDPGSGPLEGQAAGDGSGGAWVEQVGGRGWAGARELVVTVGGDGCCHAPGTGAESYPQAFGEEAQGAANNVTKITEIRGGKGRDCTKSDGDCEEAQGKVHGKVHVFLDGALRASLPVSSVLSCCRSTESCHLAASAQGGSRAAEDGSSAAEDGSSAAAHGMGDCQLTLPSEVVLGDTQTGVMHGCMG